MSKKNETFVRDLTIDDEYDIIAADSSVKDAAMKMKEAGIPDLVVVDKNDEVLGVIADFDIVTGLVAEGLSAETAKVTEIMYKIDPVTPDSTIETAFNRMRDLDVSIVPVIENNKLTGVATITDCWGMLPEKYEDQKGLIPVTNPRFANYGFTILLTALFFCFGILSPLLGITGFLKGSLKAPIAGTGTFSATYYLFDARGGGYWVRFLDFQGSNAIFGIVLFIFGILFLLLGIFSTYSVIHWANADYNLIKLERNWQSIGLLLGIITLLIEWAIYIFLMLIGALRVPGSVLTIDFGGIIFTTLAILFLIGAVSRDILFRESGKTTPMED
ncbi:MAG: cyclic nucleotide-binding/CBS domain-containing protein [Candidatus Hodarchaeota archaeon]